MSNNFLHPQTAHNARLPRKVVFTESEEEASSDDNAGPPSISINDNQFPMKGSPQIAGGSSSRGREQVGVARKKVPVGPGHSTMDWGKLKASGTDMRGGVKQLQRYTPSEIAKHRTKDDMWMAFQGKVYCCTMYLPYHPGGVAQLMRGAGIDATELFMKVHPWVNMDYIMGDKCLVGYLIPESMKTPSKPLSTTSTPTSSRPSSGPTQPAAASTPRKERSPSPIQFKIPAPKQPAPMKPSKKSIGETLNSLHTSNKLILFYGTQTGTAKDLSHRLARDVYTHIGVETAVCDPAEYDMSGLLTVTAGRVDKVVVGFLMATYGEGDPTDNAYDFYEWLMDGRGKGADDKVEEIGGEMVVKQKGVGLNYLVFGLGDRTHEQLNAVARRITRRFDAIGAKRVGDVGLGDASKSTEADFVAWKTNILDSLRVFYGMKPVETAKPLRDTPHSPLFSLSVETSTPSANIFYGELSATAKPRRFSKDASGTIREASPPQKYDAKTPFFSRITMSRNLFSETFDEHNISATDSVPTPLPKHFTLTQTPSIKVDRHCIHMEFDISESGMRYETGDHVGIYGANSVDAVQTLAKILGLNDEELNQVINLKANNPSANVPFPTPCSVRTAFTHYLAIGNVVKQHHLEILGKYTANENEKQIIFSLADNHADYVAKVEKPQMNLREVLSHFPSIKVPLSVVLGELLTPLAVRYYSISSSSLKDPQTISITAVTVRYILPHPSLPEPPTTTPAHIAFKEGLVTSHIYRLHEGTTGLQKPTTDPTLPSFTTHLPLFIRTSTFRLPKDPLTPVIMIGPGTGIAPFRAFIQDRVHIAQSGTPVGRTWLFYGCRGTTQDHLYKDEIAGLVGTSVSMNVDMRVFNAFSREGEGEKKVYVQDLVVEMGRDVFEVLDLRVGGGVLYVCGDAKGMAAGVLKALETVAVKFGGFAEGGGGEWVKGLKREGRYHEDVW